MHPAPHHLVNCRSSEGFTSLSRVARALGMVVVVAVLHHGPLAVEVQHCHSGVGEFLCWP
jgi:hypothetical protein